MNCDLEELTATQWAEFHHEEGDAWFERNLDKPLDDKVKRILTSLPTTPERIIEIGCGTGRYLHAMQQYYGCECWGYDPSLKAIEYGNRTYENVRLRLRRGGMLEAACDFSFKGTDILVFGFCLYVVDRCDLMAHVGLADQLLKKSGLLVIHDFDPPEPKKIPYHHRDGVFTYKMDYPALWLANPAYSLVTKTTVREGEAITIIRKDGWDKW